MYFMLAISAASRRTCAALVTTASSTDPRIMPVPGPPLIAWRARDECTAVVCWPGTAGPAREADRAEPPTSSAGTIWAGEAALRARTGVARIDPVYLAEVPGAVVVSDRACWAAAVAGRLADPDPVMVGAFLSVGYPIGAATPFRGVRALGRSQELTVTRGRLAITPARSEGAAPGGADPYSPVAGALADAVSPLRDGVPVELSLTGGKDSRLIAAALTAAKVPFRARTHGFESHPDVVVATMIAGRLGVDHVVTEPRPPGNTGNGDGPDEAHLLGRLRSAVLVSDGMLSAFENVGQPDPHPVTEPVQAGGHGGELLRGGYAQAAWRDGKPTWAWSAGGAELFRRLTTRRLGLLRPAAAGEYLASLAPCGAELARGPLRALDDFYLTNRAGRWSATARQAYLLRSPLAQPFFDDRVIRAARSVPLPDRITDRLHREVLAALCPELLDLPLAGSGWKSGPRQPWSAPGKGPGSAAAPDWRRNYADEMARLLRDYVLDFGGEGQMFDIVRRQAAERLLRPPHGDPHAAWALATLAALLSGDWLNARGPASPDPGTQN
jgi:hypothetical protein